MANNRLFYCVQKRPLLDYPCDVALRDGQDAVGYEFLVDVDREFGGDAWMGFAVGYEVKEHGGGIVEWDQRFFQCHGGGAADLLAAGVPASFSTGNEVNSLARFGEDVPGEKEQIQPTTANGWWRPLAHNVTVLDGCIGNHVAFGGHLRRVGGAGSSDWRIWLYHILVCSQPLTLVDSFFYTFPL